METNYLNPQKVNRERNYEQIASLNKDGYFTIPFERKTDFDDCRTIVNVTDLTYDQIQAVYNAPYLDVSIHTSAFDYIFPRELDSEDNKYIYVVKRGNQTFLVNNEGYGYSRYIVELKGY